MISQDYRNNYSFGSIPREDNSLRIIRLIQAEMLPSPSCATAFSIAKRSSGLNLNWKGGLPTLFLLSCIDISNTPILSFNCTDILNTFRTKSKRLLMLATSTGVLITNLLNRSKLMTYINHSTVIKKHFTTKVILDYLNNALAKSKAEPDNSNNLSLAHNTPLNACFFMRSTRTPKRKTKIRLFNQSMVTCSGKGFALCCVPVIAVCQPVTRYRPSLTTLAVTSKNLFNGVTDMLYRFKAVSRLDLRQTNKPISSFPRYTVRINAGNIKQATAKVSPFFVILEVQHG